MENLKTKITITFTSLVIGFAAGWLVNGWRLSASIAEGKAEVVRANADHFRDATKKVNEKATEHVKKSEQLKAKINELQKELKNAQKTHPLPVACRPDPERLRILKSAVAAANRAAAGQ
mgnify:CR=1 FL=1